MADIIPLDAYRRSRGILLARWILTLTAGGRTRSEVGAVSTSAPGPRNRGPEPLGDDDDPLPTHP